MHEIYNKWAIFWTHRRSLSSCKSRKLQDLYVYLVAVWRFKMECSNLFTLLALLLCRYRYLSGYVTHDTFLPQRNIEFGVVCLCTLVECYQWMLIKCYLWTLLECYQWMLVKCYLWTLVECYQWMLVKCYLWTLVVVVVVVVIVVGQTVGSISSKTLAYDCLYTLELCTASIIATS